MLKWDTYTYTAGGSLRLNRLNTSTGRCHFITIPKELISNIYDALSNRTNITYRHKDNYRETTYDIIVHIDCIHLVYTESVRDYRRPPYSYLIIPNEDIEYVLKLFNRDPCN